MVETYASAREHYIEVHFFRNLDLSESNRSWKIFLNSPSHISPPTLARYCFRRMLNTLRSSETCRKNCRSPREGVDIGEKKSMDESKCQARSDNSNRLSSGRSCEISWTELSNSSLRARSRMPFSFNPSFRSAWQMSRRDLSLGLQWKNSFSVATEPKYCAFRAFMTDPAGRRRKSLCGIGFQLSC